MEYFELNQSIHERNVDATRNRTLSWIYAAECARIRRCRFTGNQLHERWDSALAEHELTLRFLKKGNGPLLREMLRAHCRNGGRVSREPIGGEISGAG